MIVPKFLFSVNRTVQIGQRRAFVTRKNGTMFLHSSILPGDFLLTDGSYSASTVYQKEYGIFIGSGNKYIEISSISPVKLDRSQAFDWCQKNVELLPTLADLQAITADAAEAINNSLRQIGLTGIVLSNTVETEFWSQESLENQRGITSRRVMYIKSAPNLRKDDFAGLDGQVKIMRAFLPDVNLIDTNGRNKLWILQQIAPDCYYILESQVQTAPQGNIHLEGACLVVENTVGDSYVENGVMYINTHKDYFKRNSRGLYVKVGENHDRWQLKDNA